MRNSLVLANGRKPFGVGRHQVTLVDDELVMHRIPAVVSLARGITTHATAAKSRHRWALNLGSPLHRAPRPNGSTLARRGANVLVGRVGWTKKDLHSQLPCAGQSSIHSRHQCANAGG